MRPLDHPTLADLLHVLRNLSPSDEHHVRRAYAIAVRAHEGQQRDEGAPYIEHPLRVALILVNELRQREPDLICGALLHDVVEDSAITLAEIAEACGDTVAHYVELLTKEKAPPGVDKRPINRRYIRRIAEASHEALLIKLADRLDNLRSLALIDDWEKRKKYLLETYWLYLPPAQKTSRYVYRQYLTLMADYVRRDGDKLGMALNDFPELTGGVETRRNTS
jgi:GTP pyrophosphokinase